MSKLFVTTVGTSLITNSGILSREQVDTLPQELDEQYLPIKQLLNRVADSYAEFQPAIMMRDELLRQQRIIRWYLDHSLYVQAILLAREFLISLAIFRREKMTATVESLASIVYQRDRREAVRLADEYPNG